MKKILSIFLILISVSSCSTARLQDDVNSKFSIDASMGFPDNVTITWTGSPVYSKYQLYRADSEFETFYPINSLTSSLSFIDRNISAGHLYYYKIQAYNLNNIPVFTTESVQGFGGNAGLSAPTGIKSPLGKLATAIELSWNNVPEATKYMIMRSISPNGSYEKIGETPFTHSEENPWLDSNLKSGNSYYYKIISLNENQGSSPSPPVQGFTYGGDIKLKATTGIYTDKIELTWQSIPTTLEYIIFRSESANELGTVIGTIPSSATLHFIDKNIEQKVYFYSIAAKNSYLFTQSPQVIAYIKNSTAPNTPSDFTVSKGTSLDEIQLSWKKADGALQYIVQRSINNASFQEIAIVPDTGTAIYNYNDPIAANDPIYTYYYRIIAINTVPSTPTASQQGWANRPPQKFETEGIYASKVILSWNNVPEAQYYQIQYSDSPTGTYTTITDTPNKNSYTHIYNIGSLEEKTLYYKIRVKTKDGFSLWSKPITAFIKKPKAPLNFRIINNGTDEERVLNLKWNADSGAQGYHVYRATLKHRNAKPENLTDNDFKRITTTPLMLPLYSDTLTVFPMRRYVYRITSVDSGNEESAPTKGILGYRRPIDLREFMQDIDFTIIQAQTQIYNFGNMGSSGTVTGRASGNYKYKAGTATEIVAINEWNAYTSFEITIQHAANYSIKIDGLGAVQNGDLNISGLYEGKIHYNGLKGDLGGTVSRGQIGATYKGKTEMFDYTIASSFLKSVYTSTSQKPSKPSYEEGSG